MARRAALLLGTLFLALGGSVAQGSPATALEPVTLQLRWQHQFQFAGYYAALEKGYYREAGLDVRLVESHPGEDPVTPVLSGKAQYGVGNSALLLDHARGQPVVVLAAIFQHSPLALAVRADQEIANIHGLTGRPIALEPGADELIALLRREGLDTRQLDTRAHAHDIEDFTSGRVAAQSVYLTDEVYTLDQQAVPYYLLSPLQAGIDFYGDTLFTTRGEISAHPERVRAFRAASLRGWTYAMQHPEEIARLIHARYSPRHSLEHLRFEAEAMRALMRPELIEPGYFHPGRWRHIADVYAELGMVPAQLSLEGFLYSEKPQGIDPRYYAYLALGLGLAALFALLALHIYRLKHRTALSEARYRGVYEAAPIAFLVMDRQYRVTDWNRRAETTFGWTREQAIGRSVFDFLVPPSDQDSVRQIIDQTLAGNTHVCSTNANLTADGRHVLCEWHNTPMHNHQGIVCGVMSLAVDITARHELETRLTQSEQRFRLLAENAWDVIWTMDMQGHFTYVSPSVERLRGYTVEEVLHQSLPEALTPESAQRAHEGFQYLIEHGELARRRWELEQPCKDGSTVWTDLILSLIHDEAGQITGLLGITRDITEQKRIREMLHTRGVALDAAADAVMIINPLRRITYVNPAFTQMTGYMSEDVLGHDPSLLHSPAQDPRVYDELWETVNNGQVWRGQLINRRKNGTDYIESLSISPVWDEDGRIINLVAIKHDISHQKALEDRLERLAHYDSLTGLPNRILFFDRLDRLYQLVRRDQRALGLLYIDLDGFKQINDTQGHDAGDLALKEVARRLLTCVRESDTVCRMGGDEFTVLISSVDGNLCAETVARKIVDTLSEPFEINGLRQTLAASIGISLLPGDAQNTDELLQHADQAMYQVKSHGKNTWRVYHPEMNDTDTIRDPFSEHLV